MQDRKNWATAFRAARIPLIVGLFCLAALIVLLTKIQPIKGVMLPFLQDAADPLLYERDFYVEHSIIPQSSFAFDFLRAVNWDVTGAETVIGFYIICAAVSAVALWKLISGVFNIDDWLVKLAILFAAAFADSKFYPYHKGSWILENSSPFALAAGALRFWFLFFAFTGRHVAMCATLVPINILSAKTGWLLTLVAAVILYRARPTRSAMGWSWALLGMSVLAPLVSAMAGGETLPRDEALALFEVRNSAYSVEDNPFGGVWWGMLLLLVASAFTWRQRCFVSSHTRAAIEALLPISLAVFVGGGIYLSGLYRLLPVPVVVLLSPSRALESLALINYLFILAWIARTPLLLNHERVAMMIAAILLRGTTSHKWIALAGAFLLAALLSVWLRRRAPHWADKFLVLPRKTDFPFALALAAPIVAMLFTPQLSPGRVAYRVDATLGFYDSRLPDDALQMLRAIAADRQDRRIVFAAPGMDEFRPRGWNYWVRKSSIEGDPYYLSRMSHVEKVREGRRVAEAVRRSVEAGRLPDALKRDLRGLRANIVVPVAYSRSCVGCRRINTYPGWVELSP